jgi:predicted ATPase
VTAAAVAEMCVRLDGLPLAIELAASWMNVLTPQAMLAELPHTMYTLGTRRADAAERHQTLDATIGWSHNLLSDAERKLFRRLAVFEGGWTVDTGLTVCSDQASERARTLELLGSLVDKHLVTRIEDDTGGVRFRFLETIRGFAVNRLAESDELPAMRRRHAACFVSLGERAEAEFDRPAQAAWIERLEHERGNIRAALEWATTVAESGAAELGLRLAATLWLFWDVRGHMQEGREPLRELLELPESQRGTVARARALLAAGWLGYVKGDVAEVERVVAESLAIARECGDTRVSGRTLSILGTTLTAYTNDAERTASVLDETLRVAVPVGERWSVAFAQYNHGGL